MPRNKDHQHFLMMRVYLGLMIVLGCSVALFLYSYISFDQKWWAIYAQTYLLLMLGYTWYTFILLFLGDLKRPIYPAYNGEKIAVVVPCYNEKPILLKASLKSVIDAEGNKEIFVVDDGSGYKIRDDIKSIVHELKQLGTNIKIHYFEINKGKREAIHHAVSNMVKNADFIVTIDSDTVLDKFALIRIVEPLKIKKIGASTGDIRLLNEQQNWLTRLIKVHYWINLNIYKKAQSARGMVSCCSGCLSAYKTAMMKGFIDEFIQQEFMGEKCTYSDDRHLTNLTLRSGYDVVYVPQAISYTETPATIISFFKQQLRWKRGYIRESMYTLTYAWNKKKLLFLQLLLWDLTDPFLIFGSRIALILLLIFQPIFFLLFVLPVWIVFILARNIFIILHSNERIWRLCLYAFLHETVLYWLNVYALFTLKKRGWITR